MSMKETAKEEKSREKKTEKFETTLEKLQNIVRELEAGDCSLEESIQKFELGISLAKTCQDKLTQAEQKIEILLKADSSGISTKPFVEND